MGLQDRDYYRDSYSRASWRLGTRSIVFYIIVANIVVWIAQCALWNSITWSPDRYFASDPIDIFERGFVWQLLTANFLHDPQNIRHIFFNMLVLYFFGRELEEIYGRRDFLGFYLLAGVVAMLVNAVHAYFTNPVPTIGASGAVMATLFLYALFFPRREVYIWGIFKVEVWMLCAFCAVLDIWGALSGAGGTAFMAHLGGAAFGVLFRYVDLRVSSLGRVFGALKRRRQRRRFRVLPGDRVVGKREARPFESRPVEFEELEEMRSRDQVSKQIDALLDKISRHGKDSLSDAELEFLKENSQFYRSD